MEIPHFDIHMLHMLGYLMTLYWVMTLLNIENIKNSMQTAVRILVSKWWPANSTTYTWRQYFFDVLGVLLSVDKTLLNNQYESLKFVSITKGQEI